MKAILWWMLLETQLLGMIVSDLNTEADPRTLLEYFTFVLSPKAFQCLRSPEKASVNPLRFGGQ